MCGGQQAQRAWEEGGKESQACHRSSIVDVKRQGEARYRGKQGKGGFVGERRREEIGVVEREWGGQAYLQVNRRASLDYPLMGAVLMTKENWIL